MHKKKKLKIGQYVKVPFGKSIKTGIVWHEFQKQSTTGKQWGEKKEEKSSARSKLWGKEGKGKEFYFLGYSKEPTVTISQSDPLPMKILGMTMEVVFS